MPRSLSTALVILALMAPLAPANAAPTDTEGYVVALEEDGVLIDLGSERGAASGDVVELWRPLKLRHPVTGATLSDRLLIGHLRLTQVRTRLALCRPEGELQRPPAAGDVVILRQPAEGAPAAGAAKEPVVVGDGAVAVLEDVPAPRSPGSDAEPTPAAIPAATGASATEQRAVAVVRPAARRPQRVSFAPPAIATAAEPLAIGIELDHAAGAVLHARTPVDVAYESYPMQSAGPRYFVATLPAERLQAPGTQYFIEGVGADGEAVSLVGTAKQPAWITVRPPPSPAAPAPQALRFRLATDAADWNRLRGNDWVWQTEWDLSLRLRDVGLRAVGSGFGIYRGEGGTLYDLDLAGAAPERVGLTYGFVDIETGLSRMTGLIGRAVVGLHREGTGSGAQLLLRLGDDQGTYLLLGGETLVGIGLRSITELGLDAIERVPLLFRVEVTNQPAGSLGGDIGARAIAQAGYRVNEHIALTLRGSYQGRTIYHAGPGLGGGVTATW